MRNRRSGDDVEVTSTAVVLPLRSLHRGKHRLQHVLSEPERAQLIRVMADIVAAAAAPLTLFVVHDDPEVAEWALRHGAIPLAGEQPGLNPAVAQGVDEARASGCERVIVAHADLPLADDFTRFADTTTDGIVLVPDRLGDGTNVLSIPTDVEFTFAYGPGSFEHHRSIAAATGRPIHVVRDERLGFDVDHPEDLLALADRCPPELRLLLSSFAPTEHTSPASTPSSEPRDPA